MTPEIKPIVSASFKGLLPLMVSGEWQHAIFSQLGMLHYMLRIDWNASEMRTGPYRPYLGGTVLLQQAISEHL